MKEIIEQKKYKRPILVSNSELNKYDNIILSPKKLKEANETLARCPIPAEVYIESFSKLEREQGFGVSGILTCTNAHENTFLIVKMEGPYEIHFKIRTEPQILNKLIAANRNQLIKVHIRPYINNKKQFEYELIEIK